MSQHLLVKLLQWWAGIDAKLVGKLVAQLVVCRQGFGRATAPVKGDDPLAVQPLVERILGHKFVELAEDGSMTAERQLRVDLCLDGSLPPIGEPGRHWRDEVVVRQISDNVAAPERSCLIELAHGLSQCAVGSSRSPLSTRRSNAAESSASDLIARRYRPWSVITT